MSDLIRGGQITLHKYRMLMQVGRVFLRLSIGIMLFSFVFCYYHNISKAEWNLAFMYLKQEVSKSFSLDNTKNKNKTLNKSKSLDKNESLKFITDKRFEKTYAKFKITMDKAMLLASIMHLFLLGGVILYFWVKGKALKRNLNIRGIFLSSDKALKKAISKHNREFENYIPFKIADFAYPITGRKESWSAGEQSHTLILGSTGAGKTKIIQQIVYQLHKRNQKAIIVDVKGDYIEHFYRANKGDIILNPLDSRGKNWSVFHETSPLKGFSTIAKSLLPKESKGDPIWIDAARSVFAELANLYVNRNLSMAEFADKILKTDLKVLNKLLEKTGAAKIINSDIEKTALSVLMVLSTYLRPLKLYQNSKDCFSITDWVNDSQRNNFLFISSRADIKEDINPLITAQVDIAVNAIRSLTENSNIPKVWFILDEIPYFEQSIPNLKDGLAMSRSYGGCFVLGSQDMSSLSKIYSENTARSIANNCRTKIYMNIAGKETAEYCSSSLGEGEMEEWHEAISYGAHEMRDGISVNRNKIIRRSVLPSEFTLLKTGEGFISFAGFKPAKFKFSDCSFKKLNPGYIENTQLMEVFKQELEIAEEHLKTIEAKLMKPEVNQPNKELNLTTAKEDIVQQYKKNEVQIKETLDTDLETEVETEIKEKTKIVMDI